MELKKFISNTLTQIAEGVQEAINTSEGKGYLVSPTTDEIGNSCNIHFDIAVENEADGQTGIKVISGGISKRSANRISFDLKMTLPAPENAKAIAHQKATGNYLDWKKNRKEHQDSHEEETHPTPDK